MVVLPTVEGLGNHTPPRALLAIVSIPVSSIIEMGLKGAWCFPWCGCQRQRGTERGAGMGETEEKVGCQADRQTASGRKVNAQIREGKRIICLLCGRWIYHFATGLAKHFAGPSAKWRSGTPLLKNLLRISRQ